MYNNEWRCVQVLVALFAVTRNQSFIKQLVKGDSGGQSFEPSCCQNEDTKP